MADKSLKEIFVGARELLSDPAKWGKGLYHDSQHGCHCVVGACEIAAGDTVTNKVEITVGPLLLKCARNIKPRTRASSITMFNDSKRTTHADILAVLDCVIKCCDEPVL